MLLVTSVFLKPDVFVKQTTHGYMLVVLAHYSKKRKKFLNIQKMNLGHVLLVASFLHVTLFHRIFHYATTS